MRQLKALILKEFLQIIRDPSSIIISVVLPLILLLIYGFGVSLDMKPLRLGIVMEDSAPDAQSFVQSFFDNQFLEVKVARDRRTFNDEIMRGKIRGIVVIPAYFSQFRERDMQAPIQVIADGSEPNTAAFVRNYVRGVWQKWMQRQELTHDAPMPTLISIQSRFWYNEQIESRYFLVPGSIAIIITLIGTLLTALVVAREWERGTMEALLSTPVGIYQVLIGKLIPYFCLGMASMFLSTAFAVVVYSVPLRGSLWVLALVSSVFLVTALGVGLLISSLARNQFVAAQISIVSSFLPAVVLSGFIFEISSMPLPIRWLTRLIPARYFVSCLQTLFLVGNVPRLILINVGYLILLSLIIYGVIIRYTKARLD